MGGVRRIVLLAAALAFAGATLSPTHVAAANRVVVKDRTGDQSIGGPEFDLTELEVAAEDRPGKGRWLAVTWRLAGPPPPAGGGYGFEAAIAGCGVLHISVSPGTVLDRATQAVYGPQTFSTYVAVDCVADDEGVAHPPEEVVFTGNTLRAVVPTAWFPLAARAGTLRSLRAWSEVADPVVGLIRTEMLGPTADDVRSRDSLSY